MANKRALMLPPSPPRPSPSHHDKQVLGHELRTRTDLPFLGKGHSPSHSTVGALALPQASGPPEPSGRGLVPGPGETHRPGLPLGPSRFLLPTPQCCSLRLQGSGRAGLREAAAWPPSSPSTVGPQALCQLPALIMPLPAADSRAAHALAPS